MAVQQPNDIPRPWAESGQKATIPDTTSTTGRASWTAGFPEETAKPVNQGGTPPNYLDFQGVLNALSAHIFFQQAGGQYAWNSATAYPKGAIVQRGGTAYLALQDSTNKQPGSSAGAAYWSPIVTGNATGDFVTNTALASALAAYLPLAGGTLTGNLGFAAGKGINTANNARLTVNSKDVALLEDIPSVPSTPDITVNVAQGYARIGAMQICWGSDKTTWTGTSGNINWTEYTFPIAFSAAPVVVATMQGGGNPAAVQVVAPVSPATAYTQFRLTNASATDHDGIANEYFFYIAIGSWSASSGGQ